METGVCVGHRNHFSVLPVLLPFKNGMFSTLTFSYNVWVNYIKLHSQYELKCLQ
uniref:Uncharacterized protein n=1 Tax=Anguilla anguilla TaxID=7936 RepID=A0A0E9RWZ2_ANGAN